jgi:hypothetical protein
MLVLASAMLILQVTVEARSGTGDLPMASIVREVHQLWQPYLNVVFRTGADSSAGCGRVLRLLITDRPNVEADAERPAPSLGWIEFIDHEQPAEAISVSARTARTMMQDGRWLGRPLRALPPVLTQTFLARAIGRAIAHEIGHYVLRSTAHSPAGLMRARYAVDDIMDGRRSHFRLERHEEERLAALLTAPEWTQQTALPSPAARLSMRGNVAGAAAGQQCPAGL